MTEAFLAACREGDLDALVSLLDIGLLRVPVGG